MASKSTENQMFHVEHSHFGLYVHVPFCLSKCGYCDFCRVTDMTLVDDYLLAVGREMEQSRFAGAAPRTIYIGGGTPSSIGIGQLTRLLQMVHRRFDTSHVEEFTVECNPDDVTQEMAEILVGNGVRRVSMGAQSLHDEMLRMMGRRHNARQVALSIETLRSVGIDNISVDMIFGLPETDGYDFDADVQRFVELGVPHLSAYALQYEEGSRFTHMADNGQLTPKDDDMVADEYARLTDALAKAGYAHYEISNYSLEGMEAKHNSSYWDRTPYVGFGPGASSFANGDRWTNCGNVTRYINDTMHNIDMTERETLSPEEVAEEIVMLRLRTSMGLSPDEIDEPLRQKFLQNAEIEMRMGNIEQNRMGRWRIPEHKWIVSNGIIERLVEF